MFDMNAPGSRGPSKSEESREFSSKELGRYKSVQESSPESTQGQQTPAATNRYASTQELGVTNLSEADALKGEIKRLDELAAAIDSKLKNPLGMDSVMADPKARAMLRKQMEKEVSTENLDYLEDVERFNLNPSKQGFKDIYNKYVGDNGASQINLPSPIRKELDEKFQSIDVLSDAAVGKGFLEKSRQSVSNLLENDSLYRLKKEPDFKKYADEKVANLKEEKIAVVTQSDAFKSQLWKSHSNELNRGTAHRYAPLQASAPASQNVARQSLDDGYQNIDQLRTPDDGYQNVDPVLARDDGYQNVDPVLARDDGYQNVDPVQTLDDGYQNGDPVQTRDDGYQNVDPVQTLDDGYQNVDPVQTLDDGYQNVDPVQTLDDGYQNADPVQTLDDGYQNADPVQTLDDGYQNVNPGEQQGEGAQGAVVGKKLKVDPHTELVVDFERILPMGEHAVEILKDLPGLDDKLASDWESLRALLKNPDTSLQDVQGKIANIESRLRSVIDREPQKHSEQRQKEPLKNVSLQKDEFLAKGNFGEVHTLQASNGMSLVGKSPLEGALDKFLEEANREATVYAKVGQHPNIARCYGMHTVDGQPTLVLENVNGGKLEDVFENLEGAYNQRMISRQEFVGTVQHLLKGSLQGLSQFETMGLVHMDVKSDNIMFDKSTMQAKIVDMGSAQKFGGLDSPNKKVFVPNMAPEFFSQDERLNQATDSYGIGRMLFPLMERDPAFQDHFQFQPGGGAEKTFSLQGAHVEDTFDPQKLRERAKAASDKTPEGEQKWQAVKPLGQGEEWAPGAYGAKTAYVEFMNLITHPDPKMRLSPSEALKHPFMTDGFGSEEQIKAVLEKVKRKKKEMAERVNVPGGYEEA